MQVTSSAIDLISKMYMEEPIVVIMFGGAFIMHLAMMFSSFLYIFIPKKTIEQILTGGILVNKNVISGVKLLEEIFLMKLVFSGIFLGKVWIYSIILPIRKWLLKRAKRPAGRYFWFFYFEDIYTPLIVKILCGVNVIIFFTGAFMVAVIGGGGVLLHKLGIVPLEVLNQYFLLNI